MHDDTPLKITPKLASLLAGALLPDNLVPEPLRTVLITAREGKNLTHESLAQVCSLPPAYIASIEQGQIALSKGGFLTLIHALELKHEDVEPFLAEYAIKDIEEDPWSPFFPRNFDIAGAISQIREFLSMPHHIPYLKAYVQDVEKFGIPDLSTLGLSLHHLFHQGESMQRISQKDSFDRQVEFHSFLFSMFADKNLFTARPETPDAESPDTGLSPNPPPTT